MTKNNKRKFLTQRQVCSRMNFLYQASNLMAHDNNNTLAAYYGKLCRNLGTKAVMHIAPALKRTLCKRCSLPLLPGVNTTLELVEQRQQQQQAAKPQPTTDETSTAATKGKKRRIRRLRGAKRHNKGDASISASANVSSAAATSSLDSKVALQLQCSLCQSQRRFNIDEQNECWLERPEAIVQTLTLEADKREDQGKQ